MEAERVRRYSWQFYTYHIHQYMDRKWLGEGNGQGEKGTGKGEETYTTKEMPDKDD